MAKKSLLVASGEGRVVSEKPRKKVEKSKSRKVQTDARQSALVTHHSKRIAVSKIKRAAYNPRVELKPGDPEYAKLKRSIEEFGLVEDLVWNQRTGNLVGGHQRLSVLVNEFRATEVDVKVVDLTPAREKALNVALNQVQGRWDDDRLRGLLLELQASEEVDATLTGFQQCEIEAKLAALQGAQQVTTMIGVEVGEKYSVMIKCKSESDQRTVYELMRGKGYNCSVLTL